MGSVSELGYFQKQTGKREVFFPKLPLFSALALLAFSVGAVLFGQITGIGTLKNVSVNPVAIRDIILTKDEQEHVLVLDANSNAELVRFGPQEGGFVRGSLRALERIRFITNIDPKTPYRVIRWENGAVSLSDTGTGERLYLDAFGKDNSAAFAEFLEENNPSIAPGNASGNVTEDKTATTGELQGGITQ